MSYTCAKRTPAGLAAVSTLLLGTSLAAQTGLGWPLAGGDIQNTRYGASETTVGVRNAGWLRPQWIFPAADDVSATPSIDSVGNAVYFPDFAGNITKLNASTGALIWQHNVTEYGLPRGALSRTTPSLAGGLVIFGASGALGKQVVTPGYLTAIDPKTGVLVWRLEVCANTNSLMTGSPVIYNNVIYLGVSSSEEKLSNPVFRGSVVAVSLATGTLLWQTFIVPIGYSGGPVWSGTPAVDVNRNQLYVTTGNNYLVPLSVQQCEQAAKGNATQIVACQSKSNMADSVVALDLTTGQVKWFHRCSAQDNFISSCNHNAPSCPNPKGTDFDFGAGANFFTVNIQGTSMDLVGAGQKSGTYWALDANTGNVVWKTQVGPGGLLGGIEWGTAVDGQQVYVAITNSYHFKYALQPSGMQWNGGSWAALNASTGAIVWQVPDPGLDPLDPNLLIMLPVP